MRPQTVTTAALVNGANNIFQDQGGTGVGRMTLNGSLVSGGVAYLYGATSTQPQGQRISVEGTGNNLGVTLTIVGTGPGGNPVTEVLTLANNGTATTATYFRTVTSITRSATITGNIEAGWLSANGAATREFYLDRQQLPGNASLTVAVTGTVTFTAQYSVTERDPVELAYAQRAVWQSVDGLAALSATTSSNLAYPAIATRVLVTAGTGTVVYTVIQGNPY